MSGSPTQDSRADQAAEARRKKRKERAAKNRAAEPKDIVSGAGQPLDIGVRRELEEQLGHDLGSVRLHTDRDAGALTALLGADAVAVGQDVFFGEGKYQPGTEQGRALLAHELLHTIQQPYVSGALKVGRDLGEVSAPHQPAERAAEDTAQSVARGEQAPEVARESGIPAWMRYTTVHADRNRMELLDPATLVDRLTGTVARALRSDPKDSAQRVRAVLAPLSEELQERVLDRLEHRLLTSEHDFVVDLVTEIHEDGAAQSEATARVGGLLAPAVEEDTAQDVRAERAKEQEDAEREQARSERTGPAPGPEKEPADSDDPAAQGSTPENAGGAIPQGGTPGAETGKAEADKESDPRTGGDASSPKGDGEQPRSPAAQSEQTAGAAGKGGARAGAKQGSRSSADKQAEKSGAQKSGAEKNGQKGQKGQQEGGQDKGKRGGGQDGDRAGAKEAEKKAEEQAGQEDTAARDASVKEATKERESAAAAEAAKNRTPERDEGTPTAAGRNDQFPARSGTLEGARTQDELGEDEREEAEDRGGDSEVEVGGGEESAWDVKLRPEDFLPEQDLDVSGVPTSDQIDESSGSGTPSMPSFPASPPTRAEKVHAARDREDEEDAEREAAAAKDDPGTDDSPPVAGEEESAAEQSRRTESALDPEERNEPKPAPGVATRDPKQGDDPKAGPVAAEATVQEAKGRSKESGGDTQEKAAKEEQGTPTAGGPGDKASGGAEKGSAQARSDTSAKESPADSAKPGAEGEKATSDEGASGAAKAGESPGPQESKGPKAPSESDSSTDTGTSTDPDTDTGSAPPQQSDNSWFGDGSSSASQAESRTSSRTEKPSPRAQEPRTEKPKQEAPQPESTADDDAGARAESGGGGPSGGKAAASAPRGGSGGGAKGGGGGGPKGSAAKGKKTAKAAPNLSGVSPEEGLSTASNLKPHQAVEAMDSVGGAVDKDVGKEHQQLASKPPAMDRPTGAPKTLHGKPNSEEAAEYNQDKAARADDAKGEKAEVKGEKKPEGKIEAEEMEEPDFFDQVGMMAGYALGWAGDLIGLDVTAEDLAAQFAGMPTKDEAMKQAQNGTAPGVDMQGQADDKAGEQGGNTDDKSQEAAETGADDAGRKMGEDQVYPDAPKERLEGKVPKEQGGKARVGGGGANTGAVPPEAASEVAEHERKPQFKKALTDGRQDMGKSREKKEQDTRKSEAQHKRQVDKEVKSNTKEQTGKREGVLDDVDKQRADWTQEQDDELKKLGTKKSDREKKVREDVKKEEEDTDKDVEKEKETSDKDVKDKGEKAEEDAEKKKDEKTDDSKNWLSKALDWIKEQFIALRDKIVKIIKDAREAIIGALKKFKETVEGWINAAREGIVEMIKKFIEDLIEFVTSLVEAVIEIARRIRKFITDLINAALAFVTRLANALKQIMKDLLESMAKLLSDILSMLKKMLLDVLKACKDALKSILDFATKFITAFGEFMMILVDILSDPGGWLSGAKNSAYDGAKNHLFTEVKNAVKQWFNDKVKEITGLTEAVWNKLTKGGWTLEKIAKEVWDAIVPQLPFIIGEIVITKVLAKLIPGAGWGAAILEAIQAAIGSLGEILKAMGAVITWLKSVRQGGAGVLFAKAIAAGVVVLLEMAYELLLSGIGKYVKKVGKRLSGVAAKIGKDKGGPGGDKGKDGGGGDDKGGDKSAPSSTSPKPQTSTTPPAGKGPKPKDTGGSTSPGDKKAPGKDNGAPGKGKDGKPPTTKPAKPNDRNTDAPSPRPTKPKPPTTKPGKDTTPGKDTGKPGTDTSKPGKDNGKPDDKKNNTPSDKSTKPTPPTSKDKNGNPKDKDQQPDKDKQDTKPTPPAKSQQDPGKKDGPDGTKKDPGKDDKGKDQDKTPDGKKDGPGKKDPDGSRDKGPNGKEEKRDKRKEEEKDDKDDRLDKIVARIRPILKRKLKPGLAQSAHRQLLAELKWHYRLTSLYTVNRPEFTTRAVLNPEKDVITGVTEGTRDYLEKHQLPRPVLMPNPRMDVPPVAEINAKYINPKFAHDNGERPGGQYTEGWEYVEKAGLNAKGKPQWDRMHLIPRQLGGPANTGNFVPALNSINGPFYDAFEKYPALVFGSAEEAKGPPEPEDKMPIIGWYTVNLTRWEGKSKRGYPGSGGPREPYPTNHYPPGFPKTFTASWGLYGRKPERTGENHSDWTKLGASQNRTLYIDPPPVGGTKSAKVNINKSRDSEVEKALESTPKFHEAVLDIREAARVVGKDAFSGFDDMAGQLANWKSSRGHAIHGLAAELEEVKKRYDAGRFIF
ncbi:eCIS core domain-containing protein [Streptomyces sp. NPDC055663]